MQSDYAFVPLTFMLIETLVYVRRNIISQLFGDKLNIIAPIAQLVSALDLVTSSVQVEGSILTAGKRLSLKNLNVIIRAIN